MLEQIHSIIREKNDKYKSILVDKLPSPRELYPPPVILGTYSHYLPTEHIRYVDRKYTRDIGGISATFGDIARAYLIVKYGCDGHWKPRYTSAQWEYFNNWYSVPLLSVPCTYQQGYYIDIRSAWWQIACVVGWDTDYLPSSKRPRFLTMGQSPIDLPYSEIKPLRSSIISMVRPSKIRIWQCPLCQEGIKCEPINDIKHPYGSTLIQNRWNNFYNPALWSVVSDVLNGVASDCIQSGCIVYANNDGFIAHDKKSCAKLITILDSWGLSYSIKGSGAGWVSGVGSYRVGKMRSKNRVRANDLVKVNPIPHLYWLRNKFFSMAEHRRKTLQKYNELFPKGLTYSI